MKKNTTKKSGFSLVETLIAVALFSFVATMIGGSFASFLRNYIDLKKSQREMESAQYAMNLITKTIRTSTIAAGNVDGQVIKMLDHSSGQCVIFKYAGSGATGRIQVATQSGPTDVSACGAGNSFHDITKPGDIANLNFVGSPTSGSSFGNMRIGIVGASRSDIILQTTVSLRQ
jgi:prepilin-type N-terminal cleavage/methylation domain-containing protein